MQREAGLSLVLCSFFTWANTEFQMEDPMPRVPVPCFQKVKIERFTQEEVSQILKACPYSRGANKAIAFTFGNFF
jgi:hypothetical protein